VDAVDDEEGDEEGGKLSGGKTIPILDLRPPYASSSADEVEPEEALGHCPCPDPEAVPGRDDPPVPTMAYCSRPRPALEDGLLPAETADEPLMSPLAEEGRRPLEY
jgi:hypothetical protein